MLEFAKTLLEKLSFDESLFASGYEKAIQWLDHKEQEELRKWVRNRYSEYIKHTNRKY